ncbi:hypothetical protein AB0M28_15175 [Streptomyces sp. NPDC051940]|uniref:hypothetical protein n=1 Tax=Streptomyces sp. NPDC051940 TaxID=3155675 RepID=UPI00343C09B8
MLGGELVELPGTIAGIRAALGPAELARFEGEIEHTPVADLPAVLARWALSTTTAVEEDEEFFARLERGEDIGAVPAQPSPAGPTEVA